MAICFFEFFGGLKISSLPQSTQTPPIPQSNIQCLISALHCNYRNVKVSIFGSNMAIHVIWPKPISTPKNQIGGSVKFSTQKIQISTDSCGTNQALNIGCFRFQRTLNIFVWFSTDVLNSILRYQPIDGDISIIAISQLSI